MAPRVNRRRAVRAIGYLMDAAMWRERARLSRSCAPEHTAALYKIARTHLRLARMEWRGAHIGEAAGR